MFLKPKLRYCGLTIIMSNPSRMDRAELLSGVAGYWYRNELAQNGIVIAQCEVRTKEERGPLLPNTKVILLLGLDAFELWIGNASKNTLGEIRGSIYYVNNVPAIPSYLPQDAMDLKDYESAHNEILQSKNYDEPESETEGGEKRRHGVTSRSNWRFWLGQDTAKAIRILVNGGSIPESPGWFRPSYKFYPPARDVLEELTTVTGKNFYIDIETDSQFGLKCIGYSLDSETITVVPIIDYAYKWAYPELHHIMRAFSVAAQNNTVVSHNGSGFDWIVLPWKYKMYLGTRFYDTMLAQHRCWPDIEKSLGHCTSLWTNEPFHKDEGSMAYGTYEDQKKLMAYCGKDVYTMMLIKRAIDAHAKTIPGLAESIAQVMASIPAYLLMTLTGIHYKQEILDATMAANDELMMQYNRIINLLVGEKALKELNRSSKKSIAGSPTKCCNYFHAMLGYPVVAKSPKTGNPSLARKAIYKLQLALGKQDIVNPVLDFCISYREVAKESGSLKFTPWQS
jgi:hypothetical protein